MYSQTRVINRPSGDNKSSADWKLDMNELQKAITKKTKAILINTPQNVPGKVYTRYLIAYSRAHMIDICNLKELNSKQLLL